MYIVSKLQKSLTKLYLKCQKLKLIEIKKFNLKNNKKIDIFTFDGDYHFKGQATPFSTIIVKNELFYKYSINVQDYIISHEYGHIRFPLLFNLLFLFILGISLFFEILGLIILISSLILIIPLLFYNFTNWHSIISIIFGSLQITIIGLFITWLSEFDADSYAIRLLGLNKVIMARQEIIQNSIESSIKKKILNFLTHPPPKLTFYLYQKIRK